MKSIPALIGPCLCSPAFHAVRAVAIAMVAYAASAAEMTFPAKDWQEVAPETAGLDPERLRAAVEYLQKHSGRDGVRELVIIRDGRLVWRGDNVDKVHGVWSCTKSFTSTVFGLLIDDGKCSLDTLAKEFDPKLAANYPDLRLRRFATMTSGYRARGDEPRGSYKHGPSDTPFEPAEPLFVPPGARYAYWDSAMNEFGLVLTKIAGEPLEAVFKRRVADPIGMNADKWDWGDYATIDGVVVNGGSGNAGKHITISARELARFGHLMLCKGNWNGKQLISRAWVETATSVHVPRSTPWAQPESEIDGRGVYGLNWWANGTTADGKLKWPSAPAGTFAAAGHNNNRMFVIPEWRMVIVRLGLDESDGPIGDDVWGRFIALVGEAHVDASLRDAQASVEETRPLQFRHHFIDSNLPGDSYGQTALVDIDRDGDLDFISGGRDKQRSVFWFEYRKPGDWVRHVIGVNHPSDVGGTAIDVDSDGWIDHVAGGVWYRNSGKPASEPFERILFDANLSAVHDLVVADLDRDGRLDVVTMSDKNNLRWYTIPKDPREPWQRHDIGPGVHAGVAVGDIDGDGDPDVARSDVWFENTSPGRGASRGRVSPRREDRVSERLDHVIDWKEHRIPFGNPAQPYPLATRCRIVDMDRDGDADLVMTENEIRAGRIAWLENSDGKGDKWTVHDLPRGDDPPRGAYHSLAVEDFDNDGDRDIFSVEMEAISGDRQPRWFLWENLDGRAGRFAERVIFDGKLGGHEAVVADVDHDGDLDICSKLWRPRPDNANSGRNHADFLENLLVTPRPLNESRTTGRSP
jgi:CubicO group peptidase (beta-lactamase class C family)